MPRTGLWSETPRAVVTGRYAPGTMEFSPLSKVTCRSSLMLSRLLWMAPTLHAVARSPRDSSRVSNWIRGLKPAAS